MTRRHIRLAGATWVCAFALLAGSVARGQQASVPSGTGQIAGVVTTTEGGSTRSVRRAIVRIRSTELRGTREVVTDDAGRFLFLNMPAGRFTLAASKPGYVTVAYGAKTSRGAGTPIALGDGQRVMSLTLHLPRGAAISGTVRDWTGLPYSTVVTVYERANVDGRSILRSAGSQVTDARGEYRIFGLPPGEFYVGTGFAGPLGEGVTPTTDALVRWAEQQSVSNPGSPGASPPSSAPVAFAPVFYPGVTRFSAAQSIAVGEGEDRLGIDLTVRLTRALSISGVVRGPDGQAAAGVPLSVLPSGDEPLVSLSSRPRGVTNASGEFMVSNIVPGSYVVSATTALGGAFGRDGGAIPNWFAAERIEVAADVGGLVLTLQPSVAVRGRVAIADGASPLDWGRVRVAISSARSNPITITRQSPVAPDGSFAVEGLPAGQHRVSALITEPALSARRWIPESITLAGRDVLDRVFDVPPATSLDGIVVTLTDKVGDLSGRLLDGRNQLTSGYAVILFSRDPDHWTMSSSRASRTVRTGSDGTYRFEGLAAGTYYLAAAVEIDQTQLTDAAYLRQFIEGAIQVTIGFGDKKVQDLRIGG